MRFVWISNKPGIATELYSSVYRCLGTGEHKKMPATTPWFIRARLKTRQLMLLTAICDEGNIHRAAEVLNMSQPAASKLLKDLEDMLDIRNLALTSEAEDIFGTDRPFILVVRPDNYIGLISDDVSLDAVRNYLNLIMH